MEALLVFFKSDGTRKNFSIHPEKRYLIGRQETCQLRMPLASVSREHAAIFFDEEDELVIEDLGSSNGTFVNQERIEGREELTPGDVVKIGGIPLQVVIDGYPTDLEPISTESGAEGTATEADGEDSNIDSFFGFNLDDDDI